MIGGRPGPPGRSGGGGIEEGGRPGGSPAGPAAEAGRRSGIGGKGLDGMPDKETIAKPEALRVGQRLRMKREERGLTPEQAAYQSKVPLRLLQALEADDYRLLPDPAYLIRLLHDYALLLELDVNELEGEFRSAIRRPPGASLAAVPSKQASAPIPWKHVLWTAAAILIVTPLVFIALSLASRRAAERAAPPVQAPPAAVEPARPEVPPPGEAVPSAAREAAPAGGVPAAAGGPALPPGSAQWLLKAPGAAPGPPGRPYVLIARARELTWMAVRADGGDSREVLLQPGQTAQFSAETRLVVTVGNAGGVTLSLNGTPLPILGKSGEVVRDLTLPAASGGAPERPGQPAPPAGR